MKQKELRSFLLEKGWGDGDGNTLVFSEKGLQGELAENHEVYLFLDEGGHCGGRIAKIFCSVDEVCRILDGIGKKELKTIFLQDMKKEGLNK